MPSILFAKDLIKPFKKSETSYDEIVVDNVFNIDYNCSHK
jgi:hypothetical protein